MEKIDKHLSRKTISLFWQHAIRYPWYLIPLLITVPVNVVIGDFIAPYITSHVLQQISQGTYDRADLWGSFGTQIILFAICTIVSGVVGWRLSVWLVWKLEVNVLRDIATRVFRHLVGMSATFHANRFGGSLVSQANKLTGSYVRFTDSMIFNMLTLVTAMLATVIILAPRVPLYAVALVILSGLYILFAFLFSKPVREANVRESEAQSAQTGALADAMTNVMAIKSFSASGQEFGRYWDTASTTRERSLDSMYAVTRRETAASMVTSGIAIAALSMAIVGVGLFDADVQTIFLMVTYTSSIGARLWAFQNVLRQYNRAIGDASDMVKILEIEPEVKDPEQPEPLRIHAGSIQLNDVTFTHDGAPGGKPLFDKLNLHIKPGEKVGLVGMSGSGKTTLTRILLRFSDIDSGSITVDGQDITAISQDDLRSKISYVPQEPLLFHRSIAENIAYGDPSAKTKAIKAIAASANAAEFIDQLPEKYATLVGERGVKLSGGQRQRIAIARAMLKNAPILVLDEATSALDSESEVLIQDALWRLMEGRTAIVIAHRLSTIQHMDRILVMDKGRIIEQGTHKELIRAAGTYAKLWSHQSGGFIEERYGNPTDRHAILF